MTNIEKIICDYYFGQTDRFMIALMSAFTYANEYDFNKLNKVYPEMVSVFNLFNSDEEYKKRLETEYYNIQKGKFKWEE